MFIDVNYLICIFMNISENLKNDRKIMGKKKSATTRNLDPVIVDLPYTPMTISIGCQIINLDHQTAILLSSKFNPLGLCEVTWFP